MKSFKQLWREYFTALLDHDKRTPFSEPSLNAIAIRKDFGSNWVLRFGNGTAFNQSPESDTDKRLDHMN